MDKKRKRREISWRLFRISVYMQNINVDMRSRRLSCQKSQSSSARPKNAQACKQRAQHSTETTKPKATWEMSESQFERVQMVWMDERDNLRARLKYAEKARKEWVQKFEAMKIEAANKEFKLRSEVKYLTAKLNTARYSWEVERKRLEENERFEYNRANKWRDEAKKFMAKKEIEKAKKVENEELGVEVIEGIECILASHLPRNGPIAPRIKVEMETTSEKKVGTHKAVEREDQFDL
ncbi:hypothetical protein PRIPAC_97979 [Pristionchus pacificus]|uniref:Uncharacterized protein n=1 Tax=Pristionchus pacificus TaxID=54126 RepID=A0A2A6CU59_PRIPA|nr:hypothetical protein PRIPAC_97979 [Pristionchus pacificus]|eukprot:PDM81587.1 hypothetical protein PRIPAC_30568 [Pristionchus pacificus]